MSPQAYMKAWQQADREAFLALLAKDFSATEADGATYNGLTEAAQWFDAWHQRFVMLDWQLSGEYPQGFHTLAKWTLTYADASTPMMAVVVDGMSDYLIQGGKLVALSEYQLAHDHFRPYADTAV
ncbi:nuclear transport factor 2 family protein [Lacticaseibacillus jixiensis]|uniref:nuclear transport factor 2 family protein n=1 Tax=Lacticaseibacillus jixiensis TaxID=3231926 RepID=UPI0036F30B46